MATWKAEDGTSINFEVHGEGMGKENLLLLPGLLGSIGSQWRRFAEPLADNYRVILVDYRGHGLSTNAEPDLQPDTLVDDVIGLLDFLGAQTVHIAGYSIGGYLGMMLLLKKPRRVLSLLMHATKFYWTEESVNKMQAQFDPDALSDTAPNYATQLAQEHGGSRWRALVRQTSDLVGRISQQGITEGMASRIQTPIIISVGDRDEMVSLPECARLAHFLPNGGMLVLPNTRHPFSTLSQVPLIPMMKAFHRKKRR